MIVLNCDMAISVIWLIFVIGVICKIMCGICHIPKSTHYDISDIIGGIGFLVMLAVPVIW